MSTVRILSFDPGTQNFAFSVQEYTFVDGKLSMKIIGTGMFTKCVTQLTGNHMNKQIRKFVAAMKKLDKKYKPDRIFLERFQSRGLTGTTIECINIMIGLILFIFASKEPNIYLASTWKNRINKKLIGTYEGKKQLDATYKDFGLQRKHSLKTPHELDATLIGVYSASRLFGLEDFSGITPNNWKTFVEYFISTPKL